MRTAMQYKLKQHTALEIGQLVRNRRKALGITQRTLALTSGTGLRFIIELEQGKPTLQIEKILIVLKTLGFKINIETP